MHSHHAAVILRDAPSRELCAQANVEKLRHRRRVCNANVRVTTIAAKRQLIHQVAGQRREVDNKELGAVLQQHALAVQMPNEDVLASHARQRGVSVGVDLGQEILRAALPEPCLGAADCAWHNSAGVRSLTA